MWTRLELFLFIVSIKSVLVSEVSLKFPSAEDDLLKLQLCWRLDLICSTKLY